MSEHLLRCISMDVTDGETDGIIWAEPQHKKLTRQWFGDRVCSYVDELEDGEEVTITFHRHDLTRAALARYEW